MSGRRDARRLTEDERDYVDLDWLTVPLGRLRQRLFRGTTIRPPDPAGPDDSTDGDPAARPRAVDEQPEGEPPSERGREVVGALSEHRYTALSALLVLLLAVHLGKGRWAGGVDIWEHAAAVRELAAHPLHPHHPLLSATAPHQFFSPYSLLVALFSRLTHLSVVTSLNIAGIANLVLFLVALRLFVRKVVPRKHADYYALLFILFLWGPNAWFFSSFLHFDVLGLVASYPSTFVKGVVLLALWAYTNYLERNDTRWIAPVVLAASVVILTHPVDAVFLGIGLVALSFTRSDGDGGKVLVAVTIIAGSFILAVMWPYFSLRELLFGHVAVGFRQAGAGGDREMYQHVLSRMALTLIAVPFIVRRLPRWRDDALLLMFLGTVAAYWYGFATHQWSFGRLISSIQFVAAVVLAEERAVAGEAAAALGPSARTMTRWLQVTTAALVLAGMFFLRNGFEILPHQWVENLPYQWMHPYVDMVKISDFSFIEKNHNRYPVAISDIFTSLEIPTFGTKVIAAARAQAFLDTSERTTDIGRFYAPGTSAAERRQIAAKYNASLLVMPTERLTAEPATYGPLLTLGRVVATNQRFIFIDLRQTP